jgi:hypothetical protein
LTTNRTDINNSTRGLVEHLSNTAQTSVCKDTYEIKISSRVTTCAISIIKDPNVAQHVIDFVRESPNNIIFVSESPYTDCLTKTLVEHLSNTAQTSVCKDTYEIKISSRVTLRKTDLFVFG